MSDIVVNYSSEDFFYVRAGGKAPSDASCNIQYKIIQDASCQHFPTLSTQFVNLVNNCKNTKPSSRELNSWMNECLGQKDTENHNRTTYTEDYQKWVIWQDNSFNCYKKEICRNRDNAAELTKLNEDHLGSAENKANSLRSYNNELWKTGNLTIGIILLSIIIYYTR